ncbi:hypothetical protein EDB89DRAFT_1913312 [Lactarius sanguifluus]|nr:hypothetical protein EDB89DRAFT_1913312 [Lactarius sanguifluus]
MAFTTQDQWRDFQPYSLNRRGDRNVPTRFLEAARWKTYRGDEGYFINYTTGPIWYRPVEFNFEHVCWTEVTWNPIDNCWDIMQEKYPTEHSGDESTEPLQQNTLNPAHKMKTNQKKVNQKKEVLWEQ